MAVEGTKFWYLENFNIFKDLKDESLQELSRITSMQDIPKNQPIYFPQEPSNSIFFLKKEKYGIHIKHHQVIRMITNPKMKSTVI